VSTSLDGAVALTWDDNAFAANPNAFQDYRVYSTSYSFGTDYLNGQCGANWALEGSTVAPEFVVGALANGVAECFSVTAMSVGPGRRPPFGSPAGHAAAGRAQRRNLCPPGIGVSERVSLLNDLNGDGLVQNNELGRIVSGTSSAADFSVERDANDSLFFLPRRTGTLLALYDSLPVADLTSIDLAPDPSVSRSPVLDYSTTGATALPGLGYVFETRGPGGAVLYGAVRPTHVWRSIPHS
jgi:hypothetical protein